MTVWIRGWGEKGREESEVPWGTAQIGAPCCTAHTQKGSIHFYINEEKTIYSVIVPERTRNPTSYLYRLKITFKPNTFGDMLYRGCVNITPISTGAAVWVTENLLFNLLLSESPLLPFHLIHHPPSLLKLGEVTQRGKSGFPGTLLPGTFYHLYLSLSCRKTSTWRVKQKHFRNTWTNSCTYQCLMYSLSVPILFKFKVLTG